MSYAYSSRSRDKLQTCHADLILLFMEALADPECPSDMSILEGHRGEDRQNQMVAEGKSQLAWPNSRHNTSPSMAVDVAPYVGGISWDWQHYYPLAEHVKTVWQRLQQDGKTTGQYKLTWGGDWSSFRDGPHWQLDAI
jgi:peptidoglycan L-alanyl-D-glutamate endopeptidase CwlK